MIKNINCIMIQIFKFIFIEDLYSIIKLLFIQKVENFTKNK